MSYLDSLKKLVSSETRSKSRRGLKSGFDRCMVMERLESRRVLAATVTWIPNEKILTIVDQNDEVNNIVVSSVGGNVKITDKGVAISDPNNPNIAANLVDFLGIHTAGKNDTVDVSGVNSAFSALGSTAPYDFTIELGDGTDTHTGSPLAEEVTGDSTSAGAGGDTISTDDGDDRVFGLWGDDTINGGDDHDKLYGGLGNDSIHGNDGNDVIRGEADNDYLYGDLGNDDLRGAGGVDFIYGGGDADSMYGDAGNDRLYGQDGSDEIHGGHDDDRLYGGQGDDILDDDVDNGDTDELYGGSGDDTLKAKDGDGLDTLDGGGDIDVGTMDAGDTQLNIP